MKKIKFEAVQPWAYEVAPKPVPANKLIPKWFRDMQPYAPIPEYVEAKRLVVYNRNTNVSAKKCKPMFDALSSGYILPLWSDVFIDAQNYQIPLITWRAQHPVFDTQGQQAVEVETPEGFHPQPFKYINPWRIQTPKGYSVFISQPNGYRNTNFQAVPAILDTDKFNLQVLPPVWVKKGFIGVIEKGTPMVQITPFKRENWKAEFSSMKEGEYDILEEKTFNTTLVNNYIRNFWTKKNYE